MKENEMNCNKLVIAAVAALLLNTSPAFAADDDSALESYNRAMFDFKMTLE